MPAAGAHAQTHLHHLRGAEARPRAPRAPPAAPAPPPGDPAALEARLRGAERGVGRGPEIGLGGTGLQRGALPWASVWYGVCAWDPVGEGSVACCPEEGLPLRSLEPGESQVCSLEPR